MVKHLQQQVKDFGVCFFDFIQQQYTVWLFRDGFREQSALVVTNISGRRTNQSRYRVSFHVFRHIEAQQFDTHDAGDYDAPVQPGVVLTVEPGIYIAKESLGVRIEDDVLITKDGPVNLSADIPLQPDLG